MFKPFMWTLTLAAALFAESSWAHAKLIDSVPANGAQVAAPARSVTLSFDENVRLAALTLSLAGTPLPVTIDKSRPAARTVVIPVSPLAPGVYELHWTAISADDGHVTRGSLTFTIRRETTRLSRDSREFLY